MLLIVALLVGYGCSNEPTVSPEEELTTDEDPNALVVEIQKDFVDFLEALNQPTMRFTRQINLFYEYNYYGLDEAQSAWVKAYSILENSELIIDFHAQGSYDVPYHSAVAKVIQAYTFMSMVDFFGDIPFTEAKDPTTYPQPMLDQGEDVYFELLTEIDEAIVLFGETSSEFPQDIFHEAGFEVQLWIAIANSLKLRAYTNLSLTNPILAAQGISDLLSTNIIDDIQEDFQFRYAEIQSPEDLRHPFYQLLYRVENTEIYIANGLYDLMNVGDTDLPFMEKGVIDPRTRYYFYRPDDFDPSGSNLSCDGDPIYDYCYVGNYYWGRDHRDDNGIPADFYDRTRFGIYPIGGPFDRNLYVDPRMVEEGLFGAGVFPIYLSSFSQFALAEASLQLGTAGNPQTYLEQGIRISMQKVSEFANGQNLGGYGMSTADVDEYVIRVLEEYNATPSNDEKLHIIAREQFLSVYGNGLESYNTYRRTGYPKVQSPIQDGGPFPRVFRYPQSAVDSNPNIEQQLVTNQTFWDNNPPGFID